MMYRRVAAAKRASHVAVVETQVPLTMLKTMKLLLQQWRTLNAEVDTAARARVLVWRY